MLRTIVRCLTVGALGVMLSLSTVSAQTTKGAVKGEAKKGAAAVPAADRCIAKTADGDQCKRKAQAGSRYCWQHDPNRKAKGKSKSSK